MNGGLGGMSSGFGLGVTTTSSPFFRFFEVVFLPIALELGSCGGEGAAAGGSTLGTTSGTICGSGGGAGSLGSVNGGGVWEGCDDGGDIEVMSSEGERALLLDDCELGEGVSSGGGGGGSTKRNVRDAI